jgi:hypothetical protein
MGEGHPGSSLGEGVEVRRTAALGVPFSIGASMHPKQYLLVGLACVSFAAIPLIWLMEPTLRWP